MHFVFLGVRGVVKSIACASCFNRLRFVLDAYMSLFQKVLLLRL
jgi:hypothetical protein